MQSSPGGVETGPREVANNSCQMCSVPWAHCTFSQTMECLWGALTGSEVRALDPSPKSSASIDTAVELGVSGSNSWKSPVVIMKKNNKKKTTLNGVHKVCRPQSRDSPFTLGQPQKHGSPLKSVCRSIAGPSVFLGQPSLRKCCKADCFFVFFHDLFFSFPSDWVLST